MFLNFFFKVKSYEFQTEKDIKFKEEKKKNTRTCFAKFTIHAYTVKFFHITRSDFQRPGSFALVLPFLPPSLINSHLHIVTVFEESQTRLLMVLAYEILGMIHIHKADHT